MSQDMRERVWSPGYRDELSEMVRAGAQQMMRAAVEAELRKVLGRLRDGVGRRRKAGVVVQRVPAGAGGIDGGGAGDRCVCQRHGTERSGAVFSLGVVTALFEDGAAGGGGGAVAMPERGFQQ